MHVEPATSQLEWDAFLLRQRFRPFLQSFTMGEVYRDTGQKPIRLIAREGETVLGVCQAVIVPARRGRHLAVHYGPMIGEESVVSRQKPALSLPNGSVVSRLLEDLKDVASTHRCSFIRMSPFIPESDGPAFERAIGLRSVPSPMHLLGEHIWYLPLVRPDQWSYELWALGYKQDVQSLTAHSSQLTAVSEEFLLRNMRKTTRNLIRRAEREGVTVRASKDPMRDLPIFLHMHNATKARHGFTPYREDFFHAQVRRFAPRGECTLYIAEYQGQPLAASIHMHLGGETSYHHGASVMSKVPASYLLQWTAIKDALKHGDHVYSFWGVAPIEAHEDATLQTTNYKLQTQHHPFAGVTLFKTGFGGNLLNLMHCVDIPLGPSYHVTRAFEYVRKWQRGF